MEQYVEVAAVDQLRLGQVASHVVEGRAVIVATTAEGSFVYDARCPHAEFTIGPGPLWDGVEVRCDIHGARYRADEKGAVVCGPALEPLTVLTSRVVDGMLEVMVDW